MIKIKVVEYQSTRYDFVAIVIGGNGRKYKPIITRKDKTKSYTVENSVERLKKYK